MQFDVGSRIGLGRQIRLTEPLSHGTTSYSFKAHDDELDRPVFCKILRDEYTPESNYLELLRFAKNLSVLNVPGLPKLFDIGEVDGIIYQIWEWIDGITLHDLAIKPDRATPLPTAFTRYLLTQCLTALRHLHGHGIIHGDLSPHNIMVSSTLERIWLVDLAPVKMAEGSVIVTRAWAAPEVLEGGAIGPWSDLYSLGMVVTEFARRTNLEEPECLRLLTQHNPSDRPSSAEAVLMLLSRSSEGLSGAPQASPSPRAPSPEPPSPSSTQRSSISLGGLVGAAVAPVLFPFLGIAAGISGLSTFFGAAKKKLRPSAVPSPPSDKQSTALGRAPDNWSDRTGISNVPIRTSSMAEPSEADFIVMGPSLVSRERSFPLELWVGPSNHVTELKQRASDRGRLVERGARSLISLPNSVMITAVMTLPGFEVANPTEQIFWDGSIRNSAFIVTVPPNMVPGSICRDRQISRRRTSIGHNQFQYRASRESRPTRSAKRAIERPVKTVPYRIRVLFAPEYGGGFQTSAGYPCWGDRRFRGYCQFARGRSLAESVDAGNRGTRRLLFVLVSRGSPFGMGRKRVAGSAGSPWSRFHLPYSIGGPSFCRTSQRTAGTSLQ